jgi:hypothetical protein
VAQIGAAIGREFSHALLASVVRKPEVELGSALNRVVEAGLLFRQGVPPHATYLFKHALVQDAAYGTLLRQPRRALHARIAESIERQFPEIAESQPELLAHHCSEAGMIEKAATLWGRAGQRSLDRSAAMEAAVQLNRALTQVAALPSTPAVRREQIKFQVALAYALMHTKGWAMPDTKAAFDHARSLMERAEAMGEPPEDPLLLFAILYGYFAANIAAFNGDALRDLATQFLMLAEKHGTTFLIMMGHRLMAACLLLTGEIVEARRHFDQATRLYDPSAHRPLAARFGPDAGVAILSLRSWLLWSLGYPETARLGAERALKEARTLGQATALMYALTTTTVLHLFVRDYATVRAQADELVALADEKGAVLISPLITRHFV